MTNDEVMREMFDLLCRWNDSQIKADVTIMDIWRLWWSRGLQKHWQEYCKKRESST